MFDNIILFTELVEHKSFTATALNNNISQSTLSKRINQLEQQIGTQLIVHNTRVFELTEKGQFIYHQFKHLRTKLKQTIESIHEQEAIKSISANIATAFAYEIICPYIHKFSDKHPSISIELFFQHYKQDDPLEDFDISITNFQIDNDEYDSILIFEEVAQLFCSPQYAEKYGLPSTINELTKHRFIGIISNDPIHIPTYITFTNYYSKEEFIYKNSIAKIKTNLPSHMQKIGITGDYIFGSWKSLCYDDIKKGNLLQVLPDYETYHSKYFITVRKNHGKAERLFIDFIKECILEFAAIKSISHSTNEL